MAASMEYYFFKSFIWKNTSYEVRVRSYQLRIDSLKARVEIREFNLANPQVASLNLRVTSS